MTALGTEAPRRRNLDGFGPPHSAHVMTGSMLGVMIAGMNAREVMTSPVLSAVGNTPVRDIAQLLLKNHISAVPILDGNGAPIGMVSEGDLIGRDETESDARREWWLMLLAEGER